MDPQQQLLIYKAEWFDLFITRQRADGLLIKKEQEIAELSSRMHEIQTFGAPPETAANGADDAPTFAPV